MLHKIALSNTVMESGVSRTCKHAWDRW